MVDLLEAAQIAQWREAGWLSMPGALDGEQLTVARHGIESATAWAGQDDGPGLHHWEMTDSGPALARSEDLIPHHDGLRALLCAGTLLDIASQLLGEEAVLFKEKVNYKQPGGAGFAPHQDASAYRFADHHVSCMLPIDVADATTGCLSVVSGAHHGFLPRDEGGRVREDVAATLEWELAPVEPGDLLWFDSYTPHRSGSNNGDSARRALYLTYNARSAGDHRDRYYEDKRNEFATAGDTFSGERVRLSITDDFLGRPVHRP
ncbi:phytanoyl-CoA dioxygenase family protein [Actinospongicola halichondriae]|uniref:phytanoyl-CoA dioxygenase family protein n=1 Tax=Actinospongicola halichondriae TaxID=3236844 RepID=UPI003D41D5BC